LLFAIAVLLLDLAIALLLSVLLRIDLSSGSINDLTQTSGSPPKKNVMQQAA
jgi:hypothetical protein